MFKKFSTSWQVTKQSWKILSSDFRLMILPFISFVLTTIAALVTIIPLAAISAVIWGGFENLDKNPVFYLGMFFVYLVLYTIIIFFNVAFTHIIFEKYENKDVGIFESFTFAISRIFSILGYAAISATVGLILRTLSNAAESQNNKLVGLIGQIFVGILGISWNIATFLVIPVLVAKNLDPISAIKESSSMLKRTWGEQIIGTTAFGLIIFLAMLPFLIVSMLIIFIGAGTGVFPIVFFGIIMIILVAVGSSLISSSMENIFKVVLYKYSETGQIGLGFDPELVKHAFNTKKNTNG